MEKKMRTIYILLVLLLSLIVINSAAEAAKPICGDGSCNGAETCSSCPADCGVCPTPTPVVAPTPTTGAAPIPIKVIPENPKDGDTIKRGVLTILVKGYEGDTLNSQIDVTAVSKFFGKIELADYFEKRGSGIYGANVTIGKDIEAGLYAIVIHGEKSTLDDERILINVDPAIYINTSVEKNYSKGERISFKGNLSYFDKEPAKNVTVKIEVFGKDFAIINKTIKSDLKGEFNDSYLISFAEPDGAWQIKFIVTDEDGNEGLANFLTKVFTPEGIAFYTVTFLSPLMDAEFKRGTSVPITVEIKDEGLAVENATVDFKNPRGEIINLQEVKPGIYTAEYKIDFNDPLGTWKLGVQAVKTKEGITKAGGNVIPLNIRPAAINLVLLSPTATEFFTGFKTDIMAELTYSDGTKVENANVTAKIGNTTIELAKIKPGTYSASYLFTEKDTGTKSLELSASDVHGNIITTPAKAIGIRKISETELQLRLFYYNIIERYWYAIALLVVLTAAGTRPIWYGRYLERIIKNSTDEEKRVLAMEKDTQLKYFKDHSINKAEYDKLMLKNKERMADLKEKKLKAQKGMEKLKGKK